jgi:hypothetical protein
VKRKPIAVLSILAVSIVLGYLFFLSWLVGVLICKYISGKSIGERGKVPSIVIPFRRWKIHIHHWFYAGCLLVFCCITSVHLLTPIITYGFLAGLVFQGIYSYSDWYRLVIKRRKTGPTTVTGFRITRNSSTDLVMPEDGTYMLPYKNILELHTVSAPSDHLD